MAWREEITGSTLEELRPERMSQEGDWEAKASAVAPPIPSLETPVITMVLPRTEAGNAAATSVAVLSRPKLVVDAIVNVIESRAIKEKEHGDSSGN